MQKVDIEASIAAIRASYERAANLPGQDTAELACNRDGIDVQVEWARWVITQIHALPPKDFFEAVGLMLGSMIVGSINYVDADDQPMVLGIMSNMMNGSVDRYMNGVMVEGESKVELVTRDVGDC